MNAKQIIAEVEWLEHLFRLPDRRLLQIADCRVEKSAANEKILNTPWPRLPRQEWLEQLLGLPDNRPLLEVKEAEEL
jgi:hypothetical protein